MNKHYLDHNQRDGMPSLSANRRATAKTLEPQANAAALIGRLFYAVLIVGFMGYYFDRVMQSIRG